MNASDFPALFAGIVFLSLAASASAAPQSAVVRRPAVDMFSKPSRDADVVSQAIYSTSVEVLTKRGAWANIRTPDNYTGWVEKKGLRILRGGSYPATQKVAQVESLRAHIYREASVTKHAPLLSVPFDARLEVVSEGSGLAREGDDEHWIEVRLVEGATGWVQRGDVSLEAKPQNISELVELSRRFLGLPYTWGGASAFGYDCSGFTQMLCRRGGVQIPRDAQPQADWEGMTKVERNALQPGDLLYFGASADKITHTAFYLGDGRFIHATTNTHPVVQISRLDDQPWTELLVACRRWKK